MIPIWWKPHLTGNTFFHFLRPDGKSACSTWTYIHGSGIVSEFPPPKRMCKQCLKVKAERALQDDEVGRRICTKECKLAANGKPSCAYGTCAKVQSRAWWTATLKPSKG